MGKMINHKSIMVGIYKKAFPGSALGTDYDPIGEYKDIMGGVFIVLRPEYERNFAIKYTFKGDNFFFSFGQQEIPYFINMGDPDLIEKFKESMIQFELNRNYLRGYK
jgi:hypothetical protein